MEPATTRPPLLDDITKLIEDRFLEGLVRILERRFKGQGLDVDGAVGDAVEVLVRKADQLKIDDPGAYLYTVAFNRLRRDAKRIEFVDAEIAAGADRGSVEELLDDALRNETFKFLKGVVERWENASLKATALVLLEAAFLGEPLTTEDLADQLLDILGEEVSLPTVRQWKKRSLDRLEAELREHEITD